jgi:hypothetical protein
MDIRYDEKNWTSPLHRCCCCGKLLLTRVTAADGGDFAGSDVDQSKAYQPTSVVDFQTKALDFKVDARRSRTFL